MMQNLECITFLVVETRCPFQQLLKMIICLCGPGEPQTVAKIFLEKAVKHKQ